MQRTKTVNFGAIEVDIFNSIAHFHSNFKFFGMSTNVKLDARHHPRKIHMADRFVITHGLPRPFWQNIYHYSMTLSWPVFFATFAGIFFAINVLFASLYLLGDHAIANQAPAGFAGAFFFSVETVATVGYGDMHPQTLYGHVVATIEIFFGMTSIALMTGVMFARFSRPHAMILFARHPVVCPLNGQQTLMLRAANARLNVIVEASAKLRLLREEISSEGLRLRRVHDLKLVRDQHPIFILGWSLLHVIDETSPLFGMTLEQLRETSASLILTIDGVDETTTQTMQSRQVYLHSEIRWQHRYIDLLYIDENGIDHFDYTRFHQIEPVPELP